MNKKLLMVAYLYPPHGGGGTQRTVKFAKYLPTFNIEPIILTSASQRKRHQDNSYDSANQHKVIRAESISLNDRFARLIEPFISPDIQKLWVNSAIKKGLVAGVRNQVDAVYSTSMPYSNHIVALTIANKLNIPWIADFRDLWTSNALYKARAPWLKHLHKKLELKLYKRADHICCASPTHRQVLIDNFGISPQKITTITNGFDQDDFKNIKPAESQPKKITMSYFGSFYGKYRPDDFVAAIKLLKEDNNPLINKLQISFVGDMDRRSRALLQDPDIADLVSYQGYVPHAELEKTRLQSDAFFLYLPDLPEPIGASIPQKVFEYLAGQRPIFAVLPKSDAADILNKYKRSIIVEPGNPEIIARALNRFISEVLTGKLRSSSENLSAYDRRVLTGKLAEVINKKVQ